MVEVKPYRMEDALQLLKSPGEIAWAKLNEVSGPGFSGWLDGKLLGCGGIRVYGLGEAWAIFSPEAKDDMKIELFRQARKKLKEMIKSNNLWQVIATTRNITAQQANFLEHLGFEKSECYIYRR